ncbi:MAG: RNA polymerase factor sigma-32 [Myxococcales bacterium]|nr:RNA polymerase factor sigma-32 [Myxococcota bacterium]MDW8282421.1 RNA polymerase factor sigma-32 [Myxococcales bacterium]
MARRTKSSDIQQEGRTSPRARRSSRKGKAQTVAQTEDGTILTGEILDEELPDGGDDADLDPADLAEVEAALPALVDEDLTEGEPQDELIVDHAVLTDEHSRSLVKSDPLTAYMNEIRRYPLLSREEEQRLAIEYAKTRDPSIARCLIVSNLRLVVKLAHEYRRACRNLLDLIQEGNLGLLQAVQKYDPYRGVKLSSYAAWWIRAYMLKFILNNWRLVKIGTTQAQRKLFFNLSKERERLEAAGFTPTTRVLAERLAVPEREVAEMQIRLGAGEMSLDAPVGRNDENGRKQVEMLESSGELRPDVTTEGREFREMLRSKLEEFEKTLKGREQTLFRERLVSDNPLTLQEVGERYGISRERARQLEARLLGRLKVFLKRELGDAVQVAMGIEE